jgi:hypothetical protein
MALLALGVPVAFIGLQMSFFSADRQQSLALHDISS